MLVVRCDTDWRRVNIETRKAVIQIVGGQTLQIARQLLTRVTVAAAEWPVPGPQPEIHQVTQLFAVIGIVADNIDIADTALTTFIDRHVDGDAVARQLSDFDIDRGAITTPRGIHFLDTLADSFHGSAGKNTPFDNIGGLHIAADIVRLQYPVAGNIDFADRRAFQHGDQQYTVLARHFDFFEVLRGGNGTDNFSRHAWLHGLANTHRQQTEHYAG